jgi:hypothetical protein
MILKTVFRMIWVAIAFLLAASAALACLFLLGTMWGLEVWRTASPRDPVSYSLLGPAFSITGFTSIVLPVLKMWPALLIAVAGEVLRLRSWMYYVLGGGISLAVNPILGQPRLAELPAAIAGQYLSIFAAAGFVGGFIYWLLAGARA